MDRIDKYALNIPSIFAQGVLVYNKKDILLSKRSMDYFYSLLYLSRDELIDKNPELLKQKKNGGYKINKKISWNIELDIYMYNIASIINTWHKSDFTALKSFILVLNDLWVEPNILGKAKNEACRTIKIVEYAYVDNTSKKVIVKFNIDYIKYYIHTQKLFKKITLNYFFNLPTPKDKVIYLLLADYIGVSKKIDKKIFKRFVNTVDAYTIEKSLSNIIKNTDIDIGTAVEKKRKGEFIIKFTPIRKFKALDEYDLIENNIKKQLWNKAEENTPQADKDGKPLNDKYKYTLKIYNTLKKQSFQPLMDIQIEINKQKSELSQYKDEQYNQYMI